MTDDQPCTALLGSCAQRNARGRVTSSTISSVIGEGKSAKNGNWTKRTETAGKWPTRSRAGTCAGNRHRHWGSENRRQILPLSPPAYLDRFSAFFRANWTALAESTILSATARRFAEFFRDSTNLSLPTLPRPIDGVIPAEVSLSPSEVSSSPETPRGVVSSPGDIYRIHFACVTNR